jgi:hypothetical protein
MGNWLRKHALDYKGKCLAHTIHGSAQSNYEGSVDDKEFLNVLRGSVVSKVKDLKENYSKREAMSIINGLAQELKDIGYFVPESYFFEITHPRKAKKRRRELSRLMSIE